MNWIKDLSYGQKRELEFCSIIAPELGLVPKQGLLEDFVDVKGQKWELKSERRTTMQTSNIAVEMVSSFRRQGAMYNARDNGVKYIVYLFADNIYFVYDFEKLFFFS